MILKKMKKRLGKFDIMLEDISQNGKPSYKLEDEETSWNTSGEESFQKVGREKVDSLRTSIKELEELIKNREKLSKEIFNEAEKVKVEISNFFVQNPTGEQEVREKIALKQKQVEISELQLKEKVNCWQDVAQLKKELREREKELSEKQGRINMLDKILE